MQKILLTGVNGQVGHVLQSQLSSDYELIALSRAQLDLTNAHQLQTAVKELKPDIIINPAAYTAVDKAETEAELAHAVNAEAPKVLAEAADRIGASMIHFSTDYVFDGSKPSAYVETDAVNPLSVYGKTKLAGEQAIQHTDTPHLILRTSWVYGAYGKNFLHTVLRLASERDCLRIVSDQLGAPTSALSIADGVKVLLKTWAGNPSQSGVYHYTNTGSGSWHAFACEIINQYIALSAKYDLPVLKSDASAVSPINTSEFPTPAVRPKNSQLSHEKLLSTFDLKLPLWEEALAEVMHAYIKMNNYVLK